MIWRQVGPDLEVNLSKVEKGDVWLPRGTGRTPHPPRTRRETHGRQIKNVTLYQKGDKDCRSSIRAGASVIVTGLNRQNALQYYDVNHRCGWHCVMEIHDGIADNVS